MSAAVAADVQAAGGCNFVDVELTLDGGDTGASHDVAFITKLKERCFSHF